MSIVSLGPRASLLLGLLCSPMTVQELADLVERALNDDDLLQVFEDFAEIGGSPRLALRSLSDGGPAEIRRQLARLERFGLVSRLAVDSSRSHLWWRVLSGAA